MDDPRAARAATEAGGVPQAVPAGVSRVAPALAATASACLSTPLGWLRVDATDVAVVGVGFVDAPSAVPSTMPTGPTGLVLDQCLSQLQAYFAGRLRGAFGVPVDPPGTAFQAAVWRVLRTIPAGYTTTYGAIAASIGRPSATRAVGAACGANPVAIVIPCHRAIGKDGRLTGYAGGIERKAWLLAHERARLV